MALETLRGLKELGGYKVAELDKFAIERPKEFVVVNHANNGLNFMLQNGPIKENGVNGCQVDTLIHAALAILVGLNRNFPCKENDAAIESLGDALMSLKARTADREERNVEGYSKA